jgi:hypothetical protein
MRRFKIGLFVALTSGVLSGCGTFSLGNVEPQAGKTADQEQLDILACKDQAHDAAASAGEQTKEFFLGLTVVGAPAAYESGKDKQREAFKTCMMAKGYVVKAAPDKAPDTTKLLYTATPTALAVPGIASLRMTWPAGFESKALSDAQKSSGAIAYAWNRAADSGVMVFAEPRAEVSDVSTYAVSKRAAWLSRVAEGSAGDITLTDIGGRKAFQCEGGGVYKGIRIKAVQTIIEGDEQLIRVFAWTSDVNWPNEASVLRELPTRVTGIK